MGGGDPPPARRRGVGTRRRAAPAGRHQADRGGRCDGWDRCARSARRPCHGGWRVRREEQRGQAEDYREPRQDEARTADEDSGRARQPPRAVHRELGRGGPWQQIRGRDAVLELLGGQPATLLDAQRAEQRDVGGRAAEADAAHPQPLAGNRRETDRALVRRPAVTHSGTVATPSVAGTPGRPL